MQHKISSSWNSVHETEYLTMAEDGIEEVSCRDVSTSVSSKPASIVSNLLRAASSRRDEMCMEAVAAGGLEQKIQELRAGKEAKEFNICPSPIHNHQDSPIDFSVKRRTSFSGSLTDDSQTSSSSPGHMTDYNTMSPSAEPGCVHDGLRFSKRDTPSPDGLRFIKRDTPSPDGLRFSKRDTHSPDGLRFSKRDTPSPGGLRFSKRDTPSPDGLDQRLHSQTKVGVQPLKMPPVLNHLGLFPGIASSLLSNGSVFNSFSQITAAALNDPRNKKNNRPFKAYPKEALQMPLGFFGIPGLTSAALQQGMDLGMLAGMNNEDLVNLYHQQIQLVRDNFSGHSLKGSTTPIGKQIHHHYQHQNHYHNLSSPATTVSSISPPLTTPDHLKTGTTASTPTVHTSNTSGSLNATLVSSTSSFALSNSRKRPSSLPDEQKDAAYWERRRKNNDAAKRSRDARRAKEDEIAMRAALLEQENLKLRVEVAALKTETERLRCMLYSN